MMVYVSLYKLFAETSKKLFLELFCAPLPTKDWLYAKGELQ